MQIQSLTAMGTEVSTKVAKENQVHLTPLCSFETDFVPFVVKHLFLVLLIVAQ
jgi:hypothetical protein